MLTDRTYDNCCNHKLSPVPSLYIRKCVSTNRDECNGVELEISTNPKQGGYRKIENIVSADGDIR